MMAHTCETSIQEAETGGLLRVQGQPRPCLKNKTKAVAAGCSSGVQLSPTMCEALDSIPSTNK